MSDSGRVRAKWYIDLAIFSVFASWAVAFVVIKRALAPGEFSPATFMLLRMALSALVMFVILAMTGQGLGLRGPNLRRMAVVGTCAYGAYYLLFTIGLKYTTTLDTALIVATGPVMTAILAPMFKVEHISRREWLGIIICLATVGAVVLAGVHGGKAEAGQTPRWDMGRLVGDLILLVAACCWALNGILSKPVLADVGATKVAAYANLFATAMMLVFCLPFMGRQDWSSISPAAWWCFAYAVMPATTLTVILFYYGIKKVGPTRTIIYQNTMPLITAILGLLFLGEGINVVQVIGMVTIFIGVYLTRTG